jgi:malonate-semialdehyde dehydrogenase (acetylating)/methylmalonate-semialdehyde dehydrogenase
MKYGLINNYVAGQFVETDTEKLDVYSPVDGSIIAQTVMSGSKEVEEAVAAAKKAQPAWAALTHKKRSQVLYNYRNLLQKYRDELAEINHFENGKDLGNAIAGIEKAIELTEFACSIPQLISGPIQEVSTGVECRIDRIPLGVVASITPFNFPVMVPHWTVPNAIALGNAVIVKPSEMTPICASKMAQMWKEAGLPDGILNIVNGGKEVVEAICDNPQISAVSFVGSTPVAEIVYKRASTAKKRVLALGGAKNHMVVTPDAVEEATVRDLIASGFGMSGQRCMAASVIIEVGDIQNIIDKLVERAKEMKPGIDLPPLITPKAIEKITNYLDKSKAEGATVLVDGRDKVDPSKPGYNFGPSIIDFRKGGKMGDEEIFGPTLEILHADSIKEAIEIQNRSPYGNAASIFTQNGRFASEAIGGFQAGMLGINIGVPVPREPFSFGGIKASKYGVGDITGVSSIDFWTYERKTTTKWNVEKKLDWMS